MDNADSSVYPCCSGQCAHVQRTGGKQIQAGYLDRISNFDSVPVDWHDLKIPYCRGWGG